MKTANGELTTVKEKIKNLKGIQIEMSINRGRKKIDIVNAIIKDVYPSVLQLKLKMQTKLCKLFHILTFCVEI